MLWVPGCTSGLGFYEWLRIVCIGSELRPTVGYESSRSDPVPVCTSRLQYCIGDSGHRIWRHHPNLCRRDKKIKVVVTYFSYQITSACRLAHLFRTLDAFSTQPAADRLVPIGGPDWLGRDSFFRQHFVRATKLDGRHPIEMKIMKINFGGQYAFLVLAPPFFQSQPGTLGSLHADPSELLLFAISDYWILVLLIYLFPGVTKHARIPLVHSISPLRHSGALI